MTEFEENVSFDIDDPDFAPSKNTTIAHNILRGMQFTDITFGVNKYLSQSSRPDRLTSLKANSTSRRLARTGFT